WLANTRGVAGIVRDLFEMLEPGYEQPGYLLVFTDDRHVDRPDVLMLQTPAIVPVVQVRHTRLAVGARDEIRTELKRPRRRCREQASDQSKSRHPSHLVGHSKVMTSCRCRYQAQ